MKHLDRESVRQRMEKHLDTGEALLAWGWAACGFRSLLMAATDRRLILLSKGVESIDYSRLEAVEAGPGDSTLPGWAKINIENAVMSAMTTHLVVKMLGDSPRHFLFRPYPFYAENKSAGLQIGQAIRSVRPSLPGEEVLEGYRKSSPDRASWWRWGGSCGVAFGLVLAIFTRSVEGALAGLILGFFLGSVFAVAWNGIRLISSGRG